MPGDSSITNLDVQFGALDLEETGFSVLADKYPSANSAPPVGNATTIPPANIDLNVSQPAALDGNTSSPPKQTQSQSSISSALSQSQMVRIITFFIYRD